MKLPAQLTATAAAQREGKIGREHIKEIQAFKERPPRDLGIREVAEGPAGRIRPPVGAMICMAWPRS